MTKETAVNELLKTADRIGITPTLYGVFGKEVKVRIPFSNKACETTIDEMEFSVRASNSMKRAGVFTVGEIIDIISNNELGQIRNLGKKTENEIKTRILALGYSKLNEREKKQFFFDILELN